MEPSANKIVIEERIREELAEALEALDHASAKDRRRAATRLNRAVGRLFDFAVRGKVPPIWEVVRTED